MGTKNIKGITIELNGDATGLNDALKGVNRQIRNTQDQLKDVEKLLKMDPGNVELLEQKQRLLGESVDEVTQKLKTLKDAEAQVQKQFSQGKASITQFEGIKREVIEAEAQLEKLTAEFKASQNAADSAGNAVEETGGALEKIGNIASGGMILEIGDQLAAIGDGAKKAGGYLVDLSNEYLNATGKASAYFGETGEAAEKTAAIIEKVWADGVGGSMEDVSDAVISVKKNLRDLDDASLENITKQAITLDQLYGVDMNETLRGVNSLMKQWGLDAQTAMDYIVAGTQNGLDKTNELGDNIAEYAGKFAQAGYSAEEYFQLLNNGLDGGAYNLDKVNDAINEVTTRLTDGTIQENMALFNDETAKVFEAWQTGKATQKDVIDSIILNIQSAKTEQEALTLAATAFGTMGEDFNRGFIESLSSLGGAYEDVTGKAVEMFDQTTTPQQEMAASIREIQMELMPIAKQLMEIAVDVLPPLFDKVKKVLSFLANNKTLTNIIIAIGTLLAVMGSIMPIISTIAAVVTAFGTAVLAPAIGIIGGVVAAIAAVIAIITNWGEITEWVSRIWNTVLNTAKDMWMSFCSNVGQKITELKTTVITRFTELKEKTFETVSNIKQIVIEKITELYTGFIEKINELKNKAIEIMEGLRAGIQDKAQNVKNAVIDGISEAIEWIKDLPSQAVTWGKDMLDGFVDGIRSKIAALKDVVNDVVDSVADFLHFTRPDKGPLREYEKWMPHMMQGLAKGIADNKHLITEQIRSLAGDMTLNVEGSGKASQSVIHNVTQLVLDGKIIAESVNDVLGEAL